MDSKDFLSSPAAIIEISRMATDLQQHARLSGQPDLPRDRALLNAMQQLHADFQTIRAFELQSR